MVYTFVKIQTHPKCADLFGWYLKVTAGNADLLWDAWQAAVHKLFWRFGTDPHLRDATKYPAHIYSIPRMGEGWMNSAQRALEQFGAIYVNPNGGMIYGNDVLIRQTIESEKCSYPSNEAVKIVIQRWSKGQHHYLTSESQLTFPKDKYDTYDEAYADARTFAEPENITSKTRHGEYRPGD
jgi:hypothetical protein